MQQHSPLLPNSSAGSQTEGRQRARMVYCSPSTGSLLSNKQSRRVLKTSYLGDHSVQISALLSRCNKGQSCSTQHLCKEASESSKARGAGPGTPPFTVPGLRQGCFPNKSPPHIPDMHCKPFKGTTSPQQSQNNHNRPNATQV